MAIGVTGSQWEHDPADDDVGPEFVADEQCRVCTDVEGASSVCAECEDARKAELAALAESLEGVRVAAVAAHAALWMGDTEAGYEPRRDTRAALRERVRSLYRAATGEHLK